MEPYDQSQRPDEDCSERAKERRCCWAKGRTEKSPERNLMQTVLEKAKDPSNAAPPISRQQMTETTKVPKTDPTLYQKTSQHPKMPTPKASILKWNTRRADWGKYTTGLQVVTHGISFNPDIHINLDKILGTVQCAAELSVPKCYNRLTNFLPEN
ncbi:hypothetical protein LSH36_306g03019 [Paralvinella palmiformis]|uniref:Uncharacterized protein n=1 Tax=Paralvinella palmiformis TaxID=53620 RepID=A0AAD9N1C4_9ANNE|nr:hypothetical protein LSH36_306g03019 [Paralvinella palmiformis]